MVWHCSRCNKELKEIPYVMPDFEGSYDCGVAQRPPLCKECWEIVCPEMQETYIKALIGRR